MFHSKNKIIFVIAFVMTAALTIQLMPPTRVTASDHIDGPQLAHDHASDINDMYFFLDPTDPDSQNTNAADNPNVVMIMTINPFIISSEAIGQAIFDHNLRYRFEIENTGDATPDEFVDVTFTRGVGRETPQFATITLPEIKGRSFGRTGGDNNARRPRFTAPVTVTIQGRDVSDTTPPAFVVTNFSLNNRERVQFFAGTTDDPFFLDNTAANRFVLSSIRNPGNPDRAIFPNRAGINAADGSDPNADNQTAAPLQNSNQGVNQGAGRDTYAGFNTLLIAVSVPASMLRGAGNELGLNGVTQRQRQQIVTESGQVVGLGRYITVDREGVPLVNNGLIPPSRKDEYNGATTADDASGRFRADLIQSLRNFGTNDANITLLLRMIQERGDILRLNLAVPNTGAGGGNNTDGGPMNMGGRRLQDDVADATFTLINNSQTLGDFVDRNDFVFGDTFPFVAPQ
ncbi:MAG: DUF4331 domain-containing protein, partial [Pyrinomonadaceae bacterium MAG19_C2-C3]|nr:DUF4331 domain-containing protein [Pyrinomonadaceae bacterium MAG19_C2-C3]